LIIFLKDLRKPTIIFSMTLILTIIITYFICLRIGFDPKVLLDDLGVGSVTNQENPGAFEMFTAFFTNNIQVPLQILLLSLIPIPFIYTLVLLVNGIMIGYRPPKVRVNKSNFGGSVPWWRFLYLSSSPANSW